MIYQLLVYAGGDSFSYDMNLNKQVSRNDYEGLLPYVEQWQETFKAKHCTCLHIIVLKLDPINGVTEVMKNDFYKHPLKARVEINKKAASGVSANKVKKTFVDVQLDQALFNQAQQGVPFPEFTVQAPPAPNNF